MRTRCLICNEELKPKDPTRRKRHDALCCGATCRKRLQRRRAAGHRVLTDLPGQQLLFGSKRQPQNAPEPTIAGLADL